jgi:hypothetical protein
MADDPVPPPLSGRPMVARLPLCGASSALSLDQADVVEEGELRPFCRGGAAPTPGLF